MDIGTNRLLIITLIFTNISFSFYYFYIYMNTKKRYIATWGFGWATYSLGFLFFIMTASEKLFILPLFSIISSLFLLLGTLRFINFKHYLQFLKISIIIIILTLIGCLLIAAQNKGPMSNFFSLFTALMLSIISVWSGIIFLRDNHMPYNLITGENVGMIQHITGWAFVVWGIHKGYYPFVNPDYYASQWNYISSIVLTNIVNISMILTYISQSNAEIARKQSVYRFLMDNSQDIIAQFNLRPEISFSYISPAVYNITGYLQTEFYARPELFGEIIHPDDRNLFYEFLNNSSDSGDTSIVFRLVRKDGKVIWLEQRTTVISGSSPGDDPSTGLSPGDDASGGAASFVVILRDITDRKEVEENLFRSETSRRHLLANISHELKTPITSIIGYLSIVMDHKKTLPKEYDSFIEACFNKSLMMDSLIEDLFELSKLEARQLRFDFETVKAGSLISAIYERLVTDIQKYGITPRLINHCPAMCGECPEISADKKRIEQVFRNLVLNSIHNTPPGGRIVLHCYCEAGLAEDSPQHNVVFAVEDNGRGISEADLPYIFERFYKKKSASHEGTGLGLNISREIVTEHKGEIWAESIENTKTTLYFKIPVIHGRR